MFVLLLALSVVVYGLIDLSPGSPEQALLPIDAWSHPESIRAIRELYELDEPAPVRFLHWLGKVAQLDLGRSLTSGEPVTRVLLQRVEMTSQLAGFALVLVLGIGVPAGMLAAARRDSGPDRFLTSGAVVASSIPAFASGLLLIYMFAVLLPWFPAFGVGEGAARIRHLTLPAVALAIPLSAIMFRQTRAAALDLMRRDFMIFAKARGLGRRRLIWNYALRNASLPIVTTTGLLVIGTMSGAVLVETVFAIPGLGSLLVSAVTARDVPVQQAITLFAGGVVMLTNLAVDLAVFVLDPRTRYPETT